MFRTRFAGWFRSCPIIWAACLVALEPVSPALRAEPPKTPLTAKQWLQLAKAKRLEGEVVPLYQQGRFREAVDRARQVLEIRKQALGEKHPEHATSLNNLAFLYNCHGDYAEAEPLYRQALNVYKQALGEKHPHYINCLSNLAGLYLTQGDYAKAEPLIRQAMAISRQVAGEKNRHYVASLNNLAGLYASQGDYAKAEPLYRQVSELSKQVLDEKDPNYATCLHNLANLYHSLGDYAKAETLSHKALAIKRDNLELAAAAQSQRQQLAKLPGVRVSLDAYLSLAPQARATVEKQYRPILALKGAVNRRQRQQRLGRLQPELAKNFADLDRVSAQLAALALAASNPEQQEARRSKMQQLTDERERLEGQLAGRSAAFRKEQELRNLEPAQLQAVLPADTVLLDFLEYTHSSPSAEKKGQWEGERRLLAFVVRRNSLERVDLGPAATVKKALDDWRLALQRRFRTKGDDDLGAAVRQLLWQPLEKHLQGAKVVLISPDSDLARVPFAALPGSKRGTYLLEEVVVAVVPVPQLLPERLAARPAAEQSEPSLLVVGDVRYDAASGGEVVADSRTAARGSADGLFHWPALANTRPEIRAIGCSFACSFPQATVTELRQVEATEAAVRRLAPRHRYLHFATHGYFAPKELRSALTTASQGKATDVGNLFGGRAGVAGFHPGLLSGVVLAGANRPLEVDKDDGILTALEMEVLDFRGVELATLSACEAGLGQVAGGEGLLGLQRAFPVAGPPYYWAAFALSGDWR